MGLEWARRELEEIREHVRSAPASKELEERLQEQMHEVWDRLADIAEKTMDPFDEELEAASAHMGAVHRAALFVRGPTRRRKRCSSCGAPMIGSFSTLGEEQKRALEERLKALNEELLALNDEIEGLEHKRDNLCLLLKRTAKEHY